MTDARDQYKATTLRILGAFQLLEYSLKLYIALSYQLIREHMKDKLHFDYSGSDVENFPLERLLNIFSKLNGNTVLIGRLNNIREERNYIAHQSLLIAMGRGYDIEAVKETHEAFYYLEDEVWECQQLVTNELEAMRAKLGAHVP